MVSLENWCLVFLCGQDMCSSLGGW
jgi:hypothetical protein